MLSIRSLQCLQLNMSYCIYLDQFGSKNINGNQIKISTESQGRFFTSSRTKKRKTRNHASWYYIKDDTLNLFIILIMQVFYTKWRKRNILWYTWWNIH